MGSAPGETSSWFRLGVSHERVFVRVEIVLAADATRPCLLCGRRGRIERERENWYFYIDSVHLAAQLDEPHGALQVHLDGALERLVKFDWGGRVEDDRHAQAGHRHVANNWHQLVEQKKLPN